jgi:O-6-methylguanine DNA methyltransferase
MQLTLDTFNSPLGPILLAGDSVQLHAVEFADHEARMNRLLAHHNRADCTLEPGRILSARQAFEAYFDGKLDALDDLSVASIGTPFQRAVWTMLRTIPAGTTWSYARLASEIGRPSAVRAVGLANGANPAAIVVPCHRVVGASGALTGYAGGVDRKRWLLSHEDALAVTVPMQFTDPVRSPALQLVR